MGPALLSRSEEETLAYLRLVPCSCGETEFRVATTVRMDGNRVVKQYAGPCARCGAPRQFAFAEAEPLAPAPPGKVVFGREGTVSTLLDPGQWLALANRAARAVTGDVDEAQAQTAMAYAVAALEEVLHFLPAEAGDFDSVPETCFVSPLGRSVLAREPPGTFRKARLVARLAAYRRLVGRMRRSNPQVAAPMPLPSCLLVVDREKKTLSFPTFVVGAGARDFIALLRAQTASTAVRRQAEPPLAAPGGGPLWSPIPLGTIRGYAAVIHLYGVEDDPSLLPLLSAEAEHIRGVILVGQEPPAAPPSPQRVLQEALARCLWAAPRPVVVFGQQELAQSWTQLGGPAPVERIDPEPAATGALAAFRAIGKAMLLSL